MVETVTRRRLPVPDARRRLRAARAGPAGGPERREARAAQGRAPRRGRRADRARRRPRGPVRVRAAGRAGPRGAARGARRRRAGPPAGAAAAAAAGRQPAGPQAAALRHHDALARARGRARPRRSGRSPSSTRWTPPAGRARGSSTACASSPLVMRRQTRAVYEEDVAVIDTEFKPDFAGRWMKHAETPARVSDGVTAQTIKYAYGAGAGIPGVENVPGPMGGGAGYIYAALSAVQEARGLSDDDLLRGLFVAAGVGAIAYTRTEPDRRSARLYRRIRRLRRDGRRGDRGDGRRVPRGCRERGVARPAGVHGPALRPDARRPQPAVPQPHHGGHVHGARLRRPGAGRPRGRAAAARGASTSPTASAAPCRPSCCAPRRAGAARRRRHRPAGPSTGAGSTRAARRTGLRAT